MAKESVEITDEFTEANGEWSGYSAINQTQNQGLREQKHVNLRSFQPYKLSAQIKMLLLDQFTMFALDNTELATYSSTESVKAKIAIVNNENWTYGTVAPQSDRNNWYGIKVECDPEVSSVTTTQSVITQSG